MRFRVAKYVPPLEPIEWPDGTDQPVKNLTWDIQEILTDVGEGVLTMREAMPKVMTALLPGRSWDEIKSAMDAETMQGIIAYATGNFNEAMEKMRDVLGNGAGAAPNSPPETPAATSSVESPPATAVPCGT